MGRDTAHAQHRLFSIHGRRFDRERDWERKDLPFKLRTDAGSRPFCDMKLVELLERASQGYPDQYLQEYYDRETGKRKRGSGDTLAEFIVTELSETFDPDASDEEQIDSAVHALEAAIKELQGTIAALERET